MTTFSLFAIPLISAVICYVLILVLRPLLARYALARPNARSSHSVPTPQGGGAAVILATIAIVLATHWIFGSAKNIALTIVCASTFFIAYVGAVDDWRSIPVLPRLVLQAIAVAAVLTTLPGEYQLFTPIPIWVERALLLLAGLWFVNLVNFMDGIDWMTVAEVVPITVALSILGTHNYLPQDAMLVALALGGAIIGFAPFNKPVAKLFLGDVGSLAIGLLIGWCLLRLAGEGWLVAAALLPLYYIADTTITLFRRLLNREAIWNAHRKHFYQQAVRNGFSVERVVSEIFLLNLFLASVAMASVVANTPLVKIFAIILGIGSVAFVLQRFSRPKRDSSEKV